MVYKNKEAFIKAHIQPNDRVLDVGFWGQGVASTNKHWPHRILHEMGVDLYGLDLEYENEGLLAAPEHYQRQSAESFSFPVVFDVIFAGDLIEHLSNPGLFLASARAHLKPGGRILITTPNCFNLFNLTEKISKVDPTVNIDHTCYFNFKTLRQLFGKNGFEIEPPHFIYALDVPCKESFKKRFLNIVYRFLGMWTDKYMETIAVIAHPKE